MKKITLLLLVITLVFQGYSQRANVPEKVRLCEKSEVQHLTKVEYQELKSSTLWGDVIWSEDFGGGAMPAGWTVVDNNSFDYFWIWSDAANPALTGQYSTNTDPFNSTTGTNGYLTLPGDHYNMPSGSIPMDSYVISAPINCDTSASVMLKFEQYFRYCCESDPAKWVSVSNDNVTWYDYDASSGVGVNNTSPNVDIVYINITPIAANQSTVYIRFWETMNSHYYWAVDDIELITAPQNEIKFTDTYSLHYDDNFGFLGAFSEIPTNQVMSLFSEGDITNQGDITQTNVSFEATVYDASSTVVFNEVVDTASLAFNDTVNLVTDLFVIPAMVETYTSIFECYQTETDELPDNNYTDTAVFDVIQNKIFARDKQYENWVGGTFSLDAYGGSDGDFVGVEYFVTNTDTVHSVSVYIDYRTVPGSTILAQIYHDDGNQNYTFVLESEEFIVTAGDIGTWVTIPLVTQQVGDDILEGGNNFFAGIEIYEAGNPLEIGTEEPGYPHLMWMEVKYRESGTWYYISELPYVRLNFVDAVLPAYFTSEPLLTCRRDEIYVDTATVTDPQGLTVVLDAASTNTDMMLDYTDNGDGTIIITTGVTPDAAGLVNDDRFRIRIIADNGTVENEQYYWVTVIAPIEIEETANNSKINIYPNPAQNELFVSNTENADIYVYNLLGEVITNINNASSFTTIDLSDLAPGAYIITVIKGDNVYSKQFSHIK